MKKIILFLCFFLMINSSKNFSYEINNQSKKENIFILSIDGGGIRGIIPSIILKYIEDRINEPLCKKFDIIAGTSTGALIASALAVPNQQGEPRYKASDIVDLYKTKGKQIFKRSFFHQIFTLNGWIGPKYESKYAYKLYKDILKNYYFNEVLTEILIPVIDLRSNKVRYFSSIGDKNTEGPLYEAVFAATAAPTYFSSVKIIKNKRTYELIDAGCVMNNPSLASYLFTQFEKKEMNAKIKNLVILSLGTGINISGIKDSTFLENQGKLGWIFNIIDVMMSASSSLSGEQSSLLFDKKTSLFYSLKNYFRIEVDLPYYCIKLDDFSEKNISNLEMYAFKAIEDNKLKIDTIIDLLNNKK